MALSLVLAWYAATSEVPWLFLLAAWLLALIAALAAYAWWNGRGLSLRLDLKSVRPGPGTPLEELPEQLLRTAPPPAAIFEGDSLELAVGLDTAGGARGPASVSGTVGGTRIALATGLVLRGGWREIATVEALRRGPIDAAEWEISSGDFLGFFHRHAMCEDEEIGLVLPRFASLSDRRTAREVEAGIAAPRAGSGTELFGVREYRPGDSLRRIHWRSSARRGELIVREYEPPGLHLLNVVLDPAPPNIEVADQIARIGASEAWDCIRDGGRVRLVVGDDATGPTGELWSVLEWLARYPQQGPSGSRYPTNGEERVVITAGNLTLDGATRVWAVGDVELEADTAARRVGTEWPLP